MFFCCCFWRKLFSSWWQTISVCVCETCRVGGWSYVMPRRVFVFSVCVMNREEGERAQRFLILLWKVIVAAIILSSDFTITGQNYNRITRQRSTQNVHLHIFIWPKQQQQHQPVLIPIRHIRTLGVAFWRPGYRLAPSSKLARITRKRPVTFSK